MIEELLSAAPFRAAANALPGLLKVALRPPVCVDAVAAACAAAALGEVDDSVIDGTVAINAAARRPPAMGLTELLSQLTDPLKQRLFPGGAE